MFDIEMVKARIVAKFPLLTKKTLETEFIEDYSIDTLCTNGHYIKYNPEFLYAQSPDDALFMVLHEVVHIFSGHPFRLRNMPQEEKAQEACDYAANDLLVQMGLKRPNDALYSYKFRNKGAEEIYAIIKDNDPEPNADNRGKMEPDPDGEEKSQEQMVAENKQEQMEAVASARICGGIPESLERMIEKMVEPKEDWREVLAEYLVMSNDRDDYTFTKPNRRYNDGMILPDMYSEAIPVITMAVDTSGSISSSELKDMATEIMGLVEELEPEELHVIWCDSRVCNVQIIDSYGGVELKPVGGGGTNFRPPFEWVDKKGLDTELMIYLTDGYCSSFPAEPDYDTIWIVWQDEHEFKPPFGRVIVMHKD
jgi:predicted metal-dependent peptidase